MQKKTKRRSKKKMCNIWMEKNSISKVSKIHQQFQKEIN